MAKKVKNPQPSADSSADDLSIIFPETALQLSCGKVEVLEYPFLRWLELKQQHQAFIAALAQLIDKDIVADDLLEVFEDHFDQIQQLINHSTVQPVTWETLTDSDVNMLMLTWWQVNKHFFLRSLHRMARKKMQALDGPTSSIP